MDNFANFSELAAARKEGRDYSIAAHEVKESAVAVVAPHGERIELETAEMARRSRRVTLISMPSTAGRQAAVSLTCISPALISMNRAALTSLPKRMSRSLFMAARRKSGSSI